LAASFISTTGAMSAIGTYRTLRPHPPLSAIGVTADIGQPLANQAFVELKSQIQVGEPRSVIDKSIEKVNILLGASGANLGHYGEVLIQSVPVR
jgi:hypothetical protein